MNNNSLLYIHINDHALLLNTDINKHKVKYIITACVPIFTIKTFLLFSLLYIRMNGKNISFDKKNIQKK